jgi:hypothetical protein
MARPEVTGKAALGPQPKRYISGEGIRIRYASVEGKKRSRGWLDARLEDPTFPRPDLKIAGRKYWLLDRLDEYDAKQRAALSKERAA